MWHLQKAAAAAGVALQGVSAWLGSFSRAKHKTPVLKENSMPKSMIFMKKLRFQLSVLRCQWIEFSTWKLLRIPWKGFEKFRKHRCSNVFDKNMVMPSEFNWKPCGERENDSLNKGQEPQSGLVLWQRRGMHDPTQPDPRPTRPDPRPTRPDPRPTRPDPRPTRPDPRPTRPDSCPTWPDLCLTQARLRPEPCLPKTAQDTVGTAVSWLSI